MGLSGLGQTSRNPGTFPKSRRAAKPESVVRASVLGQSPRSLVTSSKSKGLVKRFEAGLCRRGVCIHQCSKDGSKGVKEVNVENHSFVLSPFVMI